MSLTGQRIIGGPTGAAPIPSNTLKIFHKVVTVAAQTIDILGVPAGYDEVVARMYNPYAGNAIYTVKPENLSTNQTQLWKFHDRATAPTYFDLTDFLWLGSGDANTVVYDGQFSLQITTGKRRKFIGSDGAIFDGLNNRLSRAIENYGWWNDIATAVTYVRIESNIATGIAVGAIVDAWAIKY